MTVRLHPFVYQLLVIRIVEIETRKTLLTLTIGYYDDDWLDYLINRLDRRKLVSETWIHQVIYHESQ